MVTGVTEGGEQSKAGYDALMHEVCVGWGYCGSVVDGKPLHVDLFIPTKGPVTANQFVDCLFEAEGMDRQRQKHRDGLRAAFIRHMGAEIVDAENLRWSTG